MVNKKAYTNGKHDLKRGVDFIGISCVFFCHDGKGKFLMHKRSKNCRDEQGDWDLGGGAQEFGDSFEDTIKREIKEEYGADAIALKYVNTLEAHRQLADGTPTHWIAILYAVEVDPNQAKNNEPFKIDEIGWFDKNNLPNPLHSMTKRNLDEIKLAGLI